MALQGIRALVTGGASGLGRATAERFAAQGASVTIMDLPSSDGQAVAEAIGANAIFAPTDVTNEDEVNAALDAGEAQFGGAANAAVSCAGIGIAVKTLSKRGPHPLESFSRVLQINSVGTFNVIRLAASRMAKLDPDEDGARGVFVNTASVAAYDGQIG